MRDEEMAVADDDGAVVGTQGQDEVRKMAGMIFAGLDGQACLADHRDFAVAVRARWSMFLSCGSSKFCG